MPHAVARAITAESDIYQLGLIFFYILQGEIPVGCVETDDVVEESKKEFFNSALLPMTKFRKQKRPALSEVEELVSRQSL